MIRIPRTSSLPLVALLAGLGTAQSYNGEGPGIVNVPLRAAALGPRGLGNGVTHVGQLHLVPHPDLGPRVQYLCATVRYSGRSDWDVMAGIYDERGSTPQFQKLYDVDHLNTSGSEFACSVSPDLTVVVLDTPAGHPVGNGNAVFATRSGSQGQFGWPQPIQNVPAGNVDPMLMLVGGRLALAYMVDGGIDCAPFDAASGVLDTAHARRLASSQGTQRLHSPSPMTDAAGNAWAMVYAASNGSVSDAWFQPSLDGCTAGQRFLGRASWLGNPAVTGGTLHFAESAGGYVDPLRVDVVAMASVRVATPGVAVVPVFAPVRRPGSGQAWATLAFGTLAPGPIPIPGIGGSPLSIVPFGTHTGMDPVDPVSGSTTLVIPISIALRGRVHAVPVLVDPLAGISIGNTGCLSFVDQAAAMLCRYRLNHFINSIDCAATPAAALAMPAELSFGECTTRDDCASSARFTFPCAGGGTCVVEYILRNCS